MNVAEVQKRVAAIRASADDDEGAHCDEDTLHRDVLKAIAAGAEDAPGLASAVLETQDIEFGRWYA